MDDGSTDDTLRILNGFNDSRLRILKNSRQIGVGQSLNKLLEHAQHETIARMDADDICLPWRFFIQKRTMLRSSSDFQFGNTIRFSRFWAVPEWPLAISDQQARTLLPFFNPFTHPTLFTTKSNIQELGGYSSGRGQDYELWLKASLHNYRINKTAFPVLLYRRHRNQHGQQLENPLSSEVNALRLELFKHSASKSRFTERLRSRVPNEGVNHRDLDRVFSSSGFLFKKMALINSRVRKN